MVSRARNSHHGVFTAASRSGLVVTTDVVAIPKAASPGHVRVNRAARDLKLTKRDFIVLDEAFSAAAGKDSIGNEIMATAAVVITRHIPFCATSDADRRFPLMSRSHLLKIRCTFSY